jgi:hypothetical protein
MGKSLYSFCLESCAVVLTQDKSAQETTFFSQERFIRAIARNETAKVRVIKLQDPKSSAHVFGLARLHPFYTQTVSLGPFGFHAYPINGGGSNDRVSILVRRLRTLRTRGFEWTVRFDHRDLADQLNRCGLAHVEGTTRVLYLDRPYELLFRGFSETTRNKIRRAQRKGVVVRRSTKSSDLAEFHAIYRKLIAERAKWGAIYNYELCKELFTFEDDVILLVAEVNGVTIAGAGFIRDGNSLYYWIGAMNYEYKAFFPYYAIIDNAISLACSDGMVTVNLGASSGISSLEQFKSFWGTKSVPYWRFFWRNPVWSTASRIRGRIRW